MEDGKRNVCWLKAFDDGFVAGADEMGGPGG